MNEGDQLEAIGVFLDKKACIRGVTVEMEKLRYERIPHKGSIL